MIKSIFKWLVELDIELYRAWEHILDPQSDFIYMQVEDKKK